MRRIVLIVLSSILILVTICVAISKTIVPMVKNANYEKKVEKQNIQFAEQLKQQQQQKEEQDNIDELPDVPENDGQRVGTYIGEYISLLNKKEYEKAYALLNTGFKEINFPTLDSYIEYASKKYSRQKVVEYNKFKLEGFVYVVDTTIKDLAIYSQPQEFNQVFRFQETEPGVFNLSFGI